MTDTVPLKEHLETLLRVQGEHFTAILAERELRYNQALLNVERNAAQAQAASKEAIDKADRATEKHFDFLNASRGMLSDQAGTFITRKELWAWLLAVMMAAAAWLKK